MSGDDSISFESASEAQTIALGERLARLLRAGDVIALEGDLGAGKTRFVRGLAQGLGCDPGAVSSPTYVLAHEYTPERDGPALVHVDAYRVRSGDDLDGLGLDRALERGGVLVVEWASRVGNWLDPGRLDVLIEHEGEDRRTITLSWRGEGRAWAERLALL
jgi:tRNA threonylcarbamoyladenosine biosynthesis protein TsaE